MGAGDRKQQVESVLAEARTLIAEGEWGRGAWRRKVVVDHGPRQVLGFTGEDYTATVDCYCVGGAVQTAAESLHAEYFLPDAYRRLEAVAKEMGLTQAAYVRAMIPLRTIINVNDRVIENKAQALRWLDAAIADIPLGG